MARKRMGSRASKRTRLTPKVGIGPSTDERPTAKDLQLLTTIRTAQRQKHLKRAKRKLPT